MIDEDEVEQVIEGPRGLDAVDALVASGVALTVMIWAFVWAEPYPHPDLWPFMSDYGWRIPLTALSVLGKLALGVFAALVYLIIRGAWMRFLDIEDELPDKFFFTRFCPLCGSMIFAFSPYAWHSAQFLSPGFALLVLAAFGIFLWQCGCGYRHLTLAGTAYLLLAFVAGVHPLGWVAVAYVMTFDIARRWSTGLVHAQREDDVDASRKMAIERTLSIVCGFIGFGCAVYFASAFYSGGTVPDGIVSIVLAWWRGCIRTALGVFRSYDALALFVGCGVAAGIMALGRRLRAYGPGSFGLATVLTSILVIVTVAYGLRAIDADERVRLALLRDYVRTTLADSEGAEWLFTDGRFDDALRFEVKRRGMRLCILNTLASPSPWESERLKELAPEPGDVDLFAAGGAEVFRAWARERPDRLATAAWQLGSAIVRRFDKIVPCTHGTVMRTSDEATKARSAEADRRFAQMTRAVLYAVEHPSMIGSLCGSVDDAVVRSFDALVWRAARMAGERSDAAKKTGRTNVAEVERMTMQALDGVNGTLRAQGSLVERLLPTAKLVLTAKESLEISLKRADFALAQRYAREVLVSSPDDAHALFALGMSSLENGDYFNATLHLEKVLKTRPNEPATLNNLALAYMKLGTMEKAKDAAEKALHANPKSSEIKDNLAAIEKAIAPSESSR